MLKNQDFKDILIDEINKMNKYFDGDDFKKLKSNISDFAPNDYHTNPQYPSLDNIKSITETAYQRAIFNGKYSEIMIGDREHRIDWLDLEVPVVLTKKSRKKSIDLIGKTNFDNRYVISELKFSNRSSSQRPEYAIFELLFYYYCILTSHNILDNRNVSHQILGRDKYKWLDIINSNPYLIITANANYWDLWFKKKTYGDDYKSSVLKLVENLKNRMQIDIILSKTENVDFSLQKKGDKPYCPSISSTSWKNII